jgi:mRNA m6A methyltransferase catalytic subunit
LPFCRLVDELVWVKCTAHGRLARSHGYYLQHAKEVCLVGQIGKPAARMPCGSDVIVAPRRGQSQKPEEIYGLIEALVPNGAGLF